MDESMLMCFAVCGIGLFDSSTKRERNEYFILEKRVDDIFETKGDHQCLRCHFAVAPPGE